MIFSISLNFNSQSNSRYFYQRTIARIIPNIMGPTKEIHVKSELSNLKKSKKKGFKHYFFFTLKIILVIVFAFLFSIVAQEGYNFLRYRSFGVNGASMYPTLNYDVVVRDHETNEVIHDDPSTSWQLGNYSNPHNQYLCDYGLMDQSEGFRDNLERFSIVVTYYPEDFSSDGVLLSNADLKIKRVIGLPGEEITFTADGELYIDDQYVEQPFLEPSSDRPLVPDEWYQRAKRETTNGQERTWILSDDEYFLVGDNRLIGCSSDSRDPRIGPIPSPCLVGEAVAVVGKCEMVPGQSSGLNWGSLRMPWDMVLL